MRNGFLLVPAAVLAGLCLAGCSVRSHQAAAPPARVTTASSGTSATSATGVAQPPTGSAPSTTARATTPTSAPSSSGPAHSPVGPRTPSCAASALHTTVLRGSGIAGRQFAQLTFTNTGTVPCTITGYPGVSLWQGGTMLGQPAQRSGKPAPTVTLAAGGNVSTMLTDYSTCNAPDADTVRIYPPNQTAYVDLPLDLTGCRLVVDPVSPTA